MKKKDIIKSVIKFAVGGLVELFVGAATNAIVNKSGGSKLSKLGAKAGGTLAGLYIADQVSEYAYKQFDEMSEGLEQMFPDSEEEDEDGEVEQ